MNTFNSCKHHGRENCESCSFFEQISAVLKPLMDKISSPLITELENILDEGWSASDLPSNPRPGQLQFVRGLWILEISHHRRLFVTERGEWVLTNRHEYPKFWFSAEGMDPDRILKAIRREDILQAVFRELEGMVTRRQSVVAALTQRRETIRQMLVDQMNTIGRRS